MSNGGLGGQFTTIAMIDKTILCLGAFPINILIVHRIEFNAGLELSMLVKETFKGTNNGWVSGQSSWNYNLEEHFNKFNKPLYAGINLRLGYKFPSQQFHFYRSSIDALLGIIPRVYPIPNQINSFIFWSWN